MYDLVVIGSGPGGYVSAIRAAQKGLKVAIVEKYSTLGGTCLNVGCIPSKNLLHSSELFYDANKKLHRYGVELGEVKLNWQTMLAMKERVILKNYKGIEFLLKKNKIDSYQGTASFIDNKKITIAKREEISAKNFIIATGSKPMFLPNIQPDKNLVITSTEALSLPKIPKKIVVIGAGVIGCELGSIYARLGTEVVMIEYEPEIIPTMDKELSISLRKSLKKIGLKFFLNSKVTSLNYLENKIEVKFENKEQSPAKIDADFCLVAVGRKAYTEGLELEKLGIECDKRGNIIVDQNLQTTQKNIYAIGDVIGGIMLAHKAEEEGCFVVDTLVGEQPHLNYRTIPSVVYTTPEVASVGYSEEELQKKFIVYKKGIFNFQSLGRASASGQTEGFAKVLADSNNDEILGVHLIGARSSDLIAEAVVAMEYRATSEDLAMINHAHPTFSEALKEASMDAFNHKPIHK